jgi:ABC-2 type transport system ATP-binding protein
MTQRTGDIAVDVRGLSKVFGQFKAVNEITFQIRRGEVFGFLGPNGAGKTTTIRVLCGILPATSGMGTVLGLDVVRESEKIKTRIGYMSQKFSLYDDLTVNENLKFYAGVHGMSGDRIGQRIDAMLTLADMHPRRDQLAGQLSGGWKQRVALACSMIHEPEMIFLDEPTAGVDPVSRRRFWDMIYRIADMGTTILVTTHYMDEAEQFDQLVFIDRGTLIASGTPEEVKRNYFRARLWEIECAPLALASDTLRSQPFVLDVSIPGGSLHVITPTDFADTGKIESALRGAGVTVDVIRETVPSLEDVFVHLAEMGRRASGEVIL